MYRTKWMTAGWLAVALVMAALMLPVSAHAISLAANGRTDYCIVIGQDAIAPEKTAANELQSYLRQVTGVEFPIINELDAKPYMSKILIGQSQSVKSMLPGQDWNSVEKDGIIVKTIGDTLILSGGRPRGALYAVYTFLEDVVGCRWWTSTESTIPRKPNLEIAPQNLQYVPKLMYREAYYCDTNANPKFCVKMKLNGHMYAITPEYGGHYTIIGWCHTFYNWIPPEKYFAEHPEWFSLVNGKRTGDHAQLCLTNDELVHEMAKVCIEQIRKDPTAGIISVAQNDWVGKCECDKCKALEEEEGSPSGPIIHFVNAVAEEVHKVYPDVLVETLAYLYSRKPPAHVHPAENVLVRLCSIDCNFAKPYTDDSNKAFRDDLTKWAAISPQLYIWDYVTNFGNSIPPQANMRILAPNLRLFVQNKAIGVFEQGDAECTVGDFVRYRAWLLAHLMWNPDLDENKLKDEFLNGYYGAAAPYISQYFDVIHDAVARDNAAFGCIHGVITFWNLDDMTKAKKLLDQAEAAVASDPTLLERVHRDRMPLDLMWLQRYAELKKTAEASNVEFVGPADPHAAAQDFIARLKKWKATGFGCGQNIDILIDQLNGGFPASSETAEKK